MNEIEEMARKLRNEKAKKWRDNNKEKVKEIQNRYWINKAKKELAKLEDRKCPICENTEIEPEHNYCKICGHKLKED